MAGAPPPPPGSAAEIRERFECVRRIEHARQQIRKLLAEGKRDQAYAVANALGEPLTTDNVVSIEHARARRAPHQPS